MRWQGESAAEAIKRARAYRDYRENWHRAFALVPHKTIHGRWVWLEWAERKFTWHTGIGWEDSGGFGVEWREL